MTAKSLESTAPVVLADVPGCNRCGAATRLFGLEPHPSVERADLRTYVCEICGGVQTKIIPLPA